jgi:hypothetical protein
VQFSESRIKCNKLLTNEANRINASYRDTSYKYKQKINSIFEKETRKTDNKDLLKMLINTYNSTINSTIEPEVKKLEAVPDAFIKISKGSTYPKMCDKPQELKKISTQAIQSYEYIWRKKLNLATHVINTVNN